MKLPIKKKWFDKLGKDKFVEFRDAHITFVCEETDETKCFDVDSSWTQGLTDTRDWLKISNEESNKLFEDDKQICFKLGKEREKR